LGAAVLAADEACAVGTVGAPDPPQAAASSAVAAAPTSAAQ
jgi:hypothetical protein